MAETLRSIGRYQIKRWLAAGAMGEIYEAHDPVIDRPIAIKVLRRDLIERDGAAGWRERFRNEARAAGRLLHPNIVTLLDYGEEGERPFLAMELVDGENLSEILKRAGRLAVEAASSIVLQTLSALEAAHAQGLIHRDIKPSNILVVKSGRVKVTDFGIAHIAASELTEEGEVLGTPAYMAPEQLNGRAVDHRADLFSTGAVFFELLAGAKPFQGTSLAESMLNMERRGPTDLGSLNPEVSAGLQRVIETALAFGPEHRHASAADFAQAIAKAGGPATTAASLADPTVVAALAQRQPPPVTAGTAEPTLDPTLLAEIERDLATLIGPLARIVVRRSARTISDIGLLHQGLAAHIESETERADFVRRGRERARRFAPPRTGGERERTPTPPGAASLDIAPDALRRVEAALTQYIGPIARIVVRRQLAKSASLDALYRELAAHIPDERDRAAFLKAQRLP